MANTLKTIEENKMVSVNKTGRKRGKRITVVTVTHTNDMPVGVLEQTLAGIYARKAKDGALAT